MEEDVCGKELTEKQLETDLETKNTEEENDRIAGGVAPSTDGESGEKPGCVAKKPIRKTGELCWVIGILLVSFGVCLCKKANLGVSMVAAPTFIVYEAVEKYWSGFSVGMLEYLVQGAILLLLVVCTQRFRVRYILSFATAVVYGYTLNLWFMILGSDPFESLALRWVMLIVGDVMTAAGVAFYFRTYLPVQAAELFVAELADRYRLSLNKTKLAFDATCLLLSVVLAFALFRDAASFDWSRIYATDFHSIGPGTVVTAVINAPMIAFFGKLIERFMDTSAAFPRLERLISRHSGGQTSARKA